MTYNIGGADEKVDVESFTKDFISEIDQVSPDLLCLQELSPNKFNILKPILDSIFGNEIVPAVPWHLQRFRVFSRFKVRNFSTYRSITKIDTTNLSPASIKVITQLKSYMPYYSTEVEVEDGIWITVFNCHFRSSAYSTARRVMKKDDSWIKKLKLINSNYKSGKIIRDFESENLRIVLDSLAQQGHRLLLAGDFNDVDGSYCMSALSRELEDAWWESGFGYGATFNAWHLRLRLDHILYDNHFILSNVFVHQTKFSDHKPLVADFILNE